MTTRVVIEMEDDDANTFLEDWTYDKSAPLLSGGYQEHPLPFVIVEVTPS